MCTIKVIDLMRNNTYPEAGHALFVAMTECMDKGENINMDLSGVDVLPSMLLNMSLGRYIETYGLTQLQKRLSFSSITKAQADRIRDYISKY